MDPNKITGAKRPMSRTEIENELWDSIEAWLTGMVDSVTNAAGAAYAAGNFHAAGQLRAGASFDVVQRDALNYAKEYRDTLMKTGEITVSEIQYGSDGKPLKDARGLDVRKSVQKQWLRGKHQTMANDISGIIIHGISEGKSTGIRQSASGNYPAGSIAADLQNYMNSYKSQASTIARTETARCYYGGEEARYTDAGVEYLQYTGAPDACEECQPYIGEIFELGTQPPLPIHPNCRCDYRPVGKHDPAYPKSKEDLYAPKQEPVEPELYMPEPELKEVPKQNNPDSTPVTKFSDLITAANLTPVRTPNIASVKSFDQLSSELSDAWHTDISFAPILANGEMLGEMKRQMSAASAVINDFGVKGLIRGEIKRTTDTTRSIVPDNVYASTYVRETKIFSEYDGMSVSVGPAIEESTMAKLEKAYASDVARGYHPKGTTVKDVYVHEFGHAIVNHIASMVKTRFYKDRPSLPKIREVDEEAGKLCRSIVTEAHTATNEILKTDMSIKDMQTALSGYAKTNYHETVAEAFSDYYANGVNAQEFSKQIIKTTKNEYKKWMEILEKRAIQNANEFGKSSSQAAVKILGYW